MCKVKGCSRPHFVGGLCGFHALQVAWRPPPRRPAAERRTGSPRRAAAPGPARP
jgi:hypothetical protein